MTVSITGPTNKTDMHAFMREFIQDRNEALFSLDRKKIDAYLRKYNGVDNSKIPEKVFWASIHKAICNIKDAPPELQSKSRKWLKDNGFSTGVYIPRKSDIER